MMAHAGRVVFVHPSDELYGADRILLDIIGMLPPERRAVAEVWLPTDLEHVDAPLCVELERLGTTVHHLDLPILRRAYRTPRTLAALAGRAYRFHRHLRRVAPDFVYCTTSAAFLAAPIARRAGVAHVIGHVQELWSSADCWVLRPMARACDRLVAISEPVKAALPQSLHGRTVVVPNATTEPERVVPVDGRTGPLRYVVASRWNGWKGHRTLLRAWDRLDEPGVLTVLGGPPASGDSVDVEALAAGLRHPDSVRVVGEVVDPHPYFEEADVLVVPSDSPEPFGLVAIEAFARGRAVIGSDAGGLADIVTDGVDGWLFPPGDAEALATVLSRLTRADVARAGARARATYEERYTAERYAADWLEALGLRAEAPSGDRDR
jgi:glycosyltransferase involved in cell wall biosynthesis